MNLLFAIGSNIHLIPPGEIQVVYGGLGFIIAASIFVLSSVAFSVLFTQKGNQSGMEPGTMDDFNITQTKEGMTIPYTVGRVRIPGNILWYGNLTTVEVTQKVKGGKGGGKKKRQTTGYEYYLDVKQGICKGKVSLIETYIQDRLKATQQTNVFFNDGTTNVEFPLEPNPNRLKDVCHIGYEQLFLGENVNTVPVIHFVVEKDYTGPVSLGNMTNGTNPAAVIHEILVQAGVDPVLEINLTSFNTAANFWYNRGYGLNLVFKQKGRIGDGIKKVLGYVDGTVFRDVEGLWTIRAFDPSDASVATFTEDDVRQIQINRKTWRQIPNKFRANYTDQDQEFTNRTLTWENPAAIRLAGFEKESNIDLTCFRDKETAQKRLYEIGKRQSYPSLSVNFKASLKYSSLKPGDVITLSHIRFGIVSAKFRISKISATEVDKNEVGIQALQMVETLHDDVFLPATGTEWTNLNPSPIELVKISFLELPWNTVTLDAAAWAVLPVRELGFETGYDVYISDNATQDFEYFGEFTSWSVCGTLSAEYTASTFAIDDTTGIFYTPYNNKDSFGTISRTQLFSVQRFGIIGNEIIGFQQVIPQGGGDVQLLGVRRGLSNTPIETHAIGTPIYLANFGNNIIQNVRFDTFYVKILPVVIDDIFDIGSVTAIQVTKTHRARKPYNPGRIEATRSGSNITIQVFPVTPGIFAPIDDAFTSLTSQKPYTNFLGDFQVEYGATTEFKTTDNFVIINAGAVNVTVKSRLNNYVSSGLTVVVGAGDGFYSETR